VQSPSFAVICNFVVPVSFFHNLALFSLSCTYDFYLCQHPWYCPRSVLSIPSLPYCLFLSPPGQLVICFSLSSLPSIPVMDECLFRYGSFSFKESFFKYSSEIPRSHFQHSSRVGPFLLIARSIFAFPPSPPQQVFAFLFRRII